MSATPVSSQQFELFHLPADFPSDEVPLAGPGTKSRIASLIREFEADVAYAQQRLAEDVRQNARHLVPEAEQATLPPRARAILDRYAVVDTLALFHRDRTRSTFIGLLAIAFLVMLVLELFAHNLPELVLELFAHNLPEIFFPVGAWTRRMRLIIGLNPVLWLGAWGLWYYAHRARYQEKYQDYRALAEGLRVQFFWSLLGLVGPGRRLLSPQAAGGAGMDSPRPPLLA